MSDNELIEAIQQLWGKVRQLPIPPLEEQSQSILAEYDSLVSFLETYPPSISPATFCECSSALVELGEEFVDLLLKGESDEVKVLLSLGQI